MTIRYAAQFTRNEKEGGFDVTLPNLGGDDLEWCTWGSSLAEARQLACELVTSYLDLCAKGNEQPIAPPAELPAEDGWEWVRPEVGAELALEIRSLRTARGMTQAQAAALLGVKQSTYSRWESPSLCNPTLNTLARLSRVFNAQLTATLRPVPSS